MGTRATYYIHYDNADAFVDFPGKQPKDHLPNYGMSDHTEECTKCKGYGGWNLRLNAYPLHDKENTPDNRHKFSHFRASCDHCNGYGYVKPEDATHVHQWVFVRNEGNCLNRNECEVCKKQWLIDSSD